MSNETVPLSPEYLQHTTEFAHVTAFIERERVSQLRKWGVQNHSAAEWMLILQEEIGEYAREVLEKNPENQKKELIQVAAVAHAMLHNLLFSEYTRDQTEGNTKV